MHWAKCFNMLLILFKVKMDKMHSVANLHLWGTHRETTASQWKQTPAQWPEYKLLVSCTWRPWFCLKLMSWFLLPLNFDSINLKEKPTYYSLVCLMNFQATPITASINCQIEERYLCGIFSQLSFEELIIKSPQRWISVRAQTQDKHWKSLLSYQSRHSQSDLPVSIFSFLAYSTYK